MYLIQQMNFLNHACIANIVATIIFLGFAAVVLVYFFCPCIAGAC